MSDLNVYASKIYSEHPLAIWALDANVGETTTFPQYSTDVYPASVNIGCTQGVPMVYGSSKSIRLIDLGDAGVPSSQPRTWANVRNDPDTIGEETWGYWSSKIGPTGDWKVVDWKTEDTIITDGIFKPSITHYGYDMFTPKGMYNTYTAEFWMRIDARTTKSTKIWGTLNTFDGLWVNDNYITLVVGKENKSYAVENWYRPMLVNVTYTPTQARLVINGQEVISLSYATDDIDFSSIDPDDDGSSTGILGFALGNNIKLYEVDCIAMYSYVVPDDVLKRRFVWGQGVREETQLSTSYETQITYADYPYAQYANNVLFPDLYNWESGYLDNLVSDRQSLRTPYYELPEIFINGRDMESLYRENRFRQKEGEQVFFTFQPEYNWDQPSYFYFDKINRLTTPPQAVYGVFAVDPGMDEGNEETLMIFKKETGDVVEITVQTDTVRYKLNDTTLVTQSVTGVFSVGFELNTLFNSATVDAGLKLFFANLSDIRMYVGGNGVGTFSGFIYSIGIDDTSSAARNGISNKFDDKGIASSSLQGVISSYTLVPRVDYGEFWLDVSTSSYWEDSIALSVLGKNLSTPKLDFFQINIGHDGSYKIEGGYYNFSTSELQTYIAFQPIADSLQKSINDFSNTQNLPVSRVVRPGSNWETTKYAVINGSVVYPPEGVDYDTLRVIIFFDVRAEGVIHSPFQIKTLELSSQAYDATAEVGTLFGATIKSTDPFAFYKESTPYLYLTKDSGVEPLEGTVEIPFNEALASPYPINMVTAWVKPNFNNMTGTTLIELEAATTTVTLTTSTSGTDKKDFTITSTNSEITDQVRLFKNNEEVSAISLEDNQWAFIGFEMPFPLNTSNTEGKTVLHQGAVYQNVTISKVTTKGLAASAIIRNYFDLRQQNYGYWTDLSDAPDNWTYRDLLSTESTFTYKTSPIDVFDIYSGNNGLVIGEDSALDIQETRGVMLLNVDWNTYDRRPA